MRAAADPAHGQRYGVATGPITLGISSLLLLAFPLMRPFTDRTGTPAEVATTFASVSWLVAHVLAGLGFVLLPVGLFALVAFLRGTCAERFASLGLIVSWIGIGLILPTAFGTEPFALRAIGQAAVHQKNTGLLDLAMAIRVGPQARVFFPGLIALAIGAALIAVAVWHSGTLPKWSGVVLALGLALFFPLFARPIRIVDGLLIGAGGVWIAFSMLQLAPLYRGGPARSYPAP